VSVIKWINGRPLVLPSLHWELDIESTAHMMMRGDKKKWLRRWAWTERGRDTVSDLIDRGYRLDVPMPITPSPLSETVSIGGFTGTLLRRARNFDAVDDKIARAGDDAGLDVGDGDSLVLQTLAKLDAVGTGARVICGKKGNAGGAGNAGYQLFMTGAERIRFTVSDGTDELEGTGNQTGVLSAGTWYSMTGVLRAVATNNDDAYTWLDGTVFGPINGTLIGSLDTSLVFRVGADSLATPANFWDGDIAFVRFWKKVGSDWTTPEIDQRIEWRNQLYLAQDQYMELQWILWDAGTPTTAIDYTDNGFDGTYTGTTFVEDPKQVYVASDWPVQVIQVSGAGPQTISPSSIASAEAFGALKANLKVTPPAIASVEAFGTLKTLLKILSAGITPAESFGTATLLPGPVSITPSGITGAEAFGTARMVSKISPSAIASAEAFGTAKIGQQIVPSGIAGAEAFGVARMVLFITPSAISSAEAFGSARIALRILPSAIASGEAFGSVQVRLAIVTAGIASAEAFGAARMVLFVKPSAIASAEAFGSAIVSTGALFISPAGIASAEAFGTLRIRLSIPPAGIASGQAFGSALIGLKIAPVGITTAEAFGSQRMQLKIAPDGIASAEAFGTLRMLLKVTPVGIGSSEAFGTPRLILYITPAGIASAEAFGLALILLVVFVEPGERRLHRTVKREAIAVSQRRGHKVAPDQTHKAEG
jgi:hypothetical protein